MKKLHILALNLFWFIDIFMSIIYIIVFYHVKIFAFSADLNN